MNHFWGKTLIAVLLTSGVAAHFTVVANESISSELDLGFRYRIETVDQQGFSDNALASTLRTRATIKTQWVNKLTSVIEFDNVSEIALDEFNSGAGTSPDRTQYPIIADPKGTEVNQAYLGYQISDLQLKVGRQRLLVGNQRFVGGVGWRQNEQTYDGLTVNSSLGEGTWTYGYISNVNRIFGEAVPAGDHAHNSHIANLDYPIADGKLSLYYFGIDNEDIAALSSTTFGARFKGSADNLDYAVEYASQSDSSDNPNDYSADYWSLEAHYKIEAASIGAGVEKLGGDLSGGQGFTTSLATLHKFQGWADVFLSTPVAGIEDFYIVGGYKINGYQFKLFLHDFSAAENSNDYGTEIDFVVTKKLTEKLNGMFKYADFNSDNPSFTSRTKIWLMLSYQL